MGCRSTGCGSPGHNVMPKATAPPMNDQQTTAPVARVAVEADVTLAQTKREIAEHLRFLADDMDAVALSMDYYGGLAPWALHAREMMGAAEMAREWADEILSA